VQLNRQWLPLEEAVGGAVRALGGMLERHRVHTHLPADLPMLHVDASLFERVLCNLLENAVKYTPQDSPIEISTAVVDDRVKIFIDDRGPGLPKHREEAIFQMFERGRKESATPGVGLGLAICRAIISAHDGAITGENRAGGGARFIIDLARGDPPKLDEVEAPTEGTQHE
jgi:two-component system sensor histidine kinase KdpD